MRFKNGFPERHLVKRPNAANEAVDELVYGYAALHRLYMVYDKRTIWDQMERKFEGEQLIGGFLEGLFLAGVLAPE